MATINPEILKSQGIRFVRIIWCDTGNVIRGKAIHIDTLAERLDIGVGLSTAQQAIPVMADPVAPIAAWDRWAKYGSDPIGLR